MRKISFFILVTVLLLTVCSCSSSSPTTYTVEVKGETLTIDTENKTISDGTYLYEYDISGYDLTITYPNGTIYSWTTDRYGNGSGGWDSDYDPYRYVPFSTLQAALEEQEYNHTPPKNIFPILLLLGLGIFVEAAPRAAWYLEYGWRFKDAEPSDLALGLNRFCGVILLVVAVVMMFS